MPQDDPAPTAAPWTALQRWTVAATVLGSSMAFIDGSIVNVALNAVQAAFGSGVAGSQWVVNAYMLMLASLILTGGALGDAFGRRRVFGLGVLVFALASLLCGLAPTLGVLIAARVLQGAGGALLIPGSLAMIGSAFDDAGRGRAVGVWSAATSATNLLGPVLGGVLVGALSWRWAFLINVPLALLTLWCLRGVPDDRPQTAARPDVWGSVLVTLGLGSVTFALIQAGRSAPGAGLPVLLLGALGALLLLAFVLWEARTPAPMLPLPLFRSAAFRGTNLLTLLLYGALGAATFFLPLNLIGVQGYSPAGAGAALVPLALLLTLLSRFAGAWGARVGPRVPLTLGPSVCAAAFLAFAVPGVGGGYVRTFLLPVTLLGLGLAVTVAPLVSAVLGSVDDRQGGTASGVNNAVSRTGGLLAVAALGLVMLGGFRADLKARVGARHLPPAVTAAMLAQADRLAQVTPPASLPPATRAALKLDVRQAFVAGFRRVSLWCAALSVLAALAGFLAYPARRGQRSGPDGTAPPA
ncbi:MFS transporter [Deinococcus aquiradiocola]|uniref:MFS transporter n=1 Tax=Deinococcus aquiradiocola TaxID=393059 RepID=A0A917P9D7_9DEIO|nr:MFS transporter [Deinococcus aquiradiocola]GGJ67537.1 MFS transporter [Deinococcus aquiradiocola]